MAGDAFDKRVPAIFICNRSALIIVHTFCRLSAACILTLQVPLPVKCPANKLQNDVTPAQAGVTDKYRDSDFSGILKNNSETQHPASPLRI
jgi:hypothetical protein